MLRPAPSAGISAPSQQPYGPSAAYADRAPDGDILVALDLGWAEHSVSGHPLGAWRPPESHQIGGE